MKPKDFIAADVLVALPNKANAKVYLAIDSPELSTLTFRLYNPFSVKGKLFKWAAQKFCTKANGLAKLMLPTLKNQKSVFVHYLESELGLRFLSSVYLATAADKVVLQLVTDNGIYGYLKFPLTEIGIKRLTTEKRAFEVLADLHVVSSLVYSGSYNLTPFIILKNIEGTIEHIPKSEYLKVLDSFHKKESFTLKKHPRVISLFKQLRTAGLEEQTTRLRQVVASSTSLYKEVYEHGDFAPWNIINTGNGLVPFDFEYFEENGLEYLDELKYNFQIEHLLNGKVGTALITAISKNVKIPEFEILFQIYLMKEMVLKSSDNTSISLEKSLLEIVSKSKN